MFKKILIVPEATAIDQPSIKRALQLADRSSTGEVFEPVHEPHLDGYLGNTEIYEPLRKRLVDDKAAALDELAAAISREGLPCTGNTRWDYPVDKAIAREALGFGADLVVVTPGSDGKSGLTSSDWRLIAHCPAPVLMIKGNAGKKYRNIIASVDPVHAHAKPADLDQDIVACAKHVQESTGAKLSLVHCFLPLAHFESEDFDRVPLKDAEDALERSRQQALNELATAASLPADAARLVEGRPDRILEAMAGSGEADLIVMGGLSRGMLADLLIGSTAERVLRDVDCDVLVVKPRDLKVDVSVSV